MPTSSGHTIYQGNGVSDVNILPNGNLLVASAYQIDEIYDNGVLVRTIPGSFRDIRGIQVDPVTGKLFVTELGNATFQLLRLDLGTGAVEGSTRVWYGNDMYITASGDLLVGSRTLPPAIFTKDLLQTVSFEGPPQEDVTQLVPEPSTTLLLVLALLLYKSSAPKRLNPAWPLASDNAARMLY